MASGTGTASKRITAGSASTTRVRPSPRPRGSCSRSSIPARTWKIPQTTPCTSSCGARRRTANGRPLRRCGTGARTGPALLFQYDQLLSAAHANNMMPIYCIYCTAPQRSKWKHQHYSGNCREYQTGCLLAAADHVPNATVRLDQIESMCIPWHYLFFRADIARCRYEHISIDREDRLLYGIYRYRHSIALIGNNRDDQGAWNHPTIDDLNGVVGRDFERLGVHETDDLDREMLSPDGENEDRVYGPLYERIRERGVQRVLVRSSRGLIRG